MNKLRVIPYYSDTYRGLVFSRSRKGARPTIVARVNTDRVVSYNPNVVLCDIEHEQINHVAHYDDRELNGVKLFNARPITMYCITGTDVNGKRFKITTATPNFYNIYNGTLWELVPLKTMAKNNRRCKRKLVKHIVN